MAVVRPYASYTTHKHTSSLTKTHNRYYYTLTPEGLDYLREWLHLPAEIVPQTHIKTQRSHAPPRGMLGGDDRDRRGGGRGGPRGDREGGYRRREEGKEGGGAPGGFEPGFRGGYGRGRGGAPRE